MRTTSQDLDYQAIFSALTAPKLVMSSELMVLDANDAFLRTVDEPASAIVGRHYLDVFPLHTEEGAGAAEVVASLDRVRATGRLEMIGPHRYDLRDADGRWTERWWITTNVPVTDATGGVSVIVHRAEDVTDIVRAYGPVRAGGAAAAGDGADAGTVEGGAKAPSPSVLDRVLSVGSTVRRYTAALVRERRAALELQDSILTPPPDPPRPAHRRAVPAGGAGGPRGR